MLEAMYEHLSDPGADPAKLKGKHAEITAMEAQELIAAEQDVLINEYLTEINAKLGEMGISGNDAKAAPAARLWKEASSKGNDMRTFHRAYMEITNLYTDWLKGQVNEAKVNLKKRDNQDNGLLEIGLDGAGRAAGSLDSKAYALALKKGEKLPSAQEIDQLTTSRYLR